MQLAKAVANAAAALVLKAKNVAQKTEDSTQQNRVIAAATQCALSTSQLVACTRVSQMLLVQSFTSPMLCSEMYNIMLVVFVGCCANYQLPGVPGAAD